MEIATIPERQNIMKAFEVGYVIVHLANIDFINKGDGTSYNPPTIILKTGQRIPIDGDYAGYQKLLEAWQEYDGEQ